MTFADRSSLGLLPRSFSAALASLHWPDSPWPSGSAALSTQAASSPSYLITSFLSLCHHVGLIALVFMAEETEATQANNLPKVTQQGTVEPGLPVGFWPRACTLYHRAVPAGGCQAMGKTGICPQGARWADRLGTGSPGSKPSAKGPESGALQRSRITRCPPHPFPSPWAVESCAVSAPRRGGI